MFWYIVNEGHAHNRSVSITSAVRASGSINFSTFQYMQTIELEIDNCISISCCQPSWCRLLSRQVCHHATCKGTSFPQKGWDNEWNSLILVDDWQQHEIKLQVLFWALKLACYWKVQESKLQNFLKHDWLSVSPHLNRLWPIASCVYYVYSIYCY